MIHSRSFVWAARPNGVEGWRPADAPHFDPGFPVHVAHDTLEHFNGDEAFENELLAFGSTLFGRMYMDRHATQVRSSADDLATFLIDQDMRVKPPAARWMKPLDDERAERLLARMTDLAFTMLVFKTAFQVSPRKISATLDRCRGWIRLGYRIANRRWKGSHKLADHLFENVYDKVSMDHDLEPPHLGERLTVTVNTDSHRVQLQREAA